MTRPYRAVSSARRSTTLPEPRRIGRSVMAWSCLSLAGLGLWPASVAGQAAPSDVVADVESVLDRFHQAASEADGATYFELFAENGVFLGTDAAERWTVEEFRAFAEPYFRQGRGWTYTPLERHVAVAEDGRTAWFDERLHNDGLGETRGSGVLVREEGSWKVAQYNLTIPVPNELADELVERIRGLAEEADDDAGAESGSRDG